MPKPVETSPVRRILMQSIMWLILAATVGLAALVDVRKNHSAAVTLAGPQRIEDFSLRLPAGWESDPDDRGDMNALLVLREPIDDSTARMLDVQIDRPSFTSIFRALGRSSRGEANRVTTQTISFGDQPARLEITRQQIDQLAREPFYIVQMSVGRQLDAGRTLRLTLTHAGVRSDAEQRQDIELMQKVAATLVTNLK